VEEVRVRVMDTVMVSMDGGFCGGQDWWLLNTAVNKHHGEAYH
jgi:hypothetical protein